MTEWKEAIIEELNDENSDVDGSSFGTSKIESKKEYALPFEPMDVTQWDCTL